MEEEDYKLFISDAPSVSPCKSDEIEVISRYFTFSTKTARKGYKFDIAHFCNKVDRCPPGYRRGLPTGGENGDEHVPFPNIYYNYKKDLLIDLPNTIFIDCGQTSSDGSTIPEEKRTLYNFEVLQCIPNYFPETGQPKAILGEGGAGNTAGWFKKHDLRCKPSTIRNGVWETGDAICPSITKSWPRVGAGPPAPIPLMLPSDELEAAWLRNYDGRNVKQNIDMKKRIKNKEFSYWPCGFNYDNGIDTPVAMCQEGKTGAIGVPCKSHYTEFCYSAWKYLLYPGNNNDIIFTNQYFNTGIPYQFGLCYKPDSPLKEYCKMDKYESSLITRILNPILAIHKKSIYDHIKAVKAEKRKYLIINSVLVALAIASASGITSFILAPLTEIISSVTARLITIVTNATARIIALLPDATIPLTEELISSLAAEAEYIQNTYNYVSNTVSNSITKFNTALAKGILNFLPEKIVEALETETGKSLITYLKTKAVDFALATSISGILGALDLSHKNTTPSKTILGTIGFFSWHITYALLVPLLNNISSDLIARYDVLDVITFIINSFNESTLIIKNNNNINEVIKNEIDILQSKSNSIMYNIILQEISILNINNKVVPVTIYKYNDNTKQYFNQINIALKCSSNCDNSYSVVESGQKIYETIDNTYLFNIESANENYKYFNSEAERLFIKPYVRTLQKNNIHQFLKNTNEAYKILKDMDFDMPFNPFQVKAYPDKTGHPYPIVNDGSFIGYLDDISISSTWFSNKTNNKLNIKDLPKALNNKYIQFKCQQIYSYPCVTCISFCNLWGAQYNNLYSKQSNNITEYCPCYYPNPTPNPNSDYITPYNTTTKEYTLDNYFKKTWNDLGKNAWWYSEIDNSYIEFGKESYNKNKLIKYPTNCNTFCKFKSSLNFTDISYTPWGISTNTSSLCYCNNTPMNCQGCISMNFPLNSQNSGEPITNCDDYCKVLHLGEEHRDGYTVFGECGNYSGTSADSITNCCNCFIYDQKDDKIKVLDNIKNNECNKCGIIQISSCEELKQKDISNHITCKNYYVNSNSKNYKCYTNPDYPNNNLNPCINIKSECNGHSAFLRGCDSLLVSPPALKPFIGNLGPTPIPKDWINDPIQYKCKNIIQDSSSTQFFCENYCDPSLNINKSNECINCKTEFSCNFISSKYTDRLDCIGPLLPLIKHPIYDCSYYYKQNNSCNFTVVDPDNSYGFKQCILTLSKECIAVQNLCKLPKIIYDTDIPNMIPGSTMISQADMLHYYCDCSTNYSNCTSKYLDWTSDDFAYKSMNLLTRPLNGLNGISLTGNNGGICYNSSPVHIPFKNINVCAVNHSNAYNFRNLDTITCNNNNDCSKSMYCYRQRGIMCTDSSNTTKDQVCKVDYTNIPDISYQNNQIITICNKYDTSDYKSVSINCLPNLPFNKPINDCIGQSYTNTQIGKFIYVSYKLKDNDRCKELSMNTSQPILDGTICPGYYKVDENGDGIQCYWSNKLNKCTWSESNELKNTKLCRAPMQPFCSKSKYNSDASSYIISDSSLCLGRYVNDCSMAVALPNSIMNNKCNGYIVKNNIKYDCVYNETKQICEDSKIKCELDISRTFLGYSKNPTICKYAVPVKTADGSKCLAYYVENDVKPRLFNKSFLQSTEISYNGSNLTFYSINEYYYNNKTHTITTHLKYKEVTAVPYLSNCLRIAKNDTKKYNYYTTRFLYNSNSKICRIIIPTLKCISNIDCTINIKLITSYIQPFLGISGWTYYSDTSAIWVGELEHPNSLYNCSKNPIGWPTNTGYICDEDPHPITHRCRERFATTISYDRFCRTDLPPNVLNRTCLLKPSPQPISPIYFPISSNATNLIPPRNYKGMSDKDDWPKPMCVPASITNTIEGNFNFKNMDDCNKELTKIKSDNLNNKCKASLGLPCTRNGHIKHLSDGCIDGRKPDTDGSSCAYGLECYKRSTIYRDINKITLCASGDGVIDDPDCVCLYKDSSYKKSDWATSFDISISSVHSGKCSRLIGHDCKYKTSLEDEKTLGVCKESECGIGLECKQSKWWVDRSDHTLTDCDATNNGICTCLPKVINSIPDITFPNNPPQTKLCDICLNIPLLHQECCGKYVYNKHTHICCKTYVSHNIYPKYINNIEQKCCGWLSYDTSSHICCDNMIQKKSTTHSCIRCNAMNYNYNNYKYSSIKELWGLTSELSCCEPHVGPYNTKTQTCCELRTVIDGTLPLLSYTISENDTSLCCDGRLIDNTKKEYACCKNTDPREGWNKSTETYYKISTEKCCDYDNLYKTFFSTNLINPNIDYSYSVVCPMDAYCGRHNDVESLHNNNLYKDWPIQCRGNYIAHEIMSNNQDKYTGCTHMEDPAKCGLTNCPTIYSERLSRTQLGILLKNIYIKDPSTCNNITIKQLKDMNATCNTIYYINGKKSYFCAKNDGHDSNIYPCRQGPKNTSECQQFRCKSGYNCTSITSLSYECAKLTVFKEIPNYESTECSNDNIEPDYPPIDNKCGLLNNVESNCILRLSSDNSYYKCEYNKSIHNTKGEYKKDSPCWGVGGTNYCDRCPGGNSFKVKADTRLWKSGCTAKSKKIEGHLRTVSHCCKYSCGDIPNIPSI